MTTMLMVTAGTEIDTAARALLREEGKAGLLIMIANNEVLPVAAEAVVMEETAEAATLLADEELEPVTTRLML